MPGAGRLRELWYRHGNPRFTEPGSREQECPSTVFQHSNVGREERSRFSTLNTQLGEGGVFVFMGLGKAKKSQTPILMVPL